MGGDGLLFECSVGLATAMPLLSPNMVLADFTAASFSGYAALTAQTFGAPYLDSGNNLQLTSPRLQWICSTTGDANIIVGYYAWREGTPDVLLFADRFTTPITITTAGDGIAFVINFEVDLSNHGTYLFTP
jgi:hypothetical protein